MKRFVPKTQCKSSAERTPYKEPIEDHTWSGNNKAISCRSRNGATNSHGKKEIFLNG